jgi:hypothetical protein
MLQAVLKFTLREAVPGRIGSSSDDLACPSVPNAGPQIVRAYLSRQHFDDVENSCPMIALLSDVARSDDSRVKQKVLAAGG